ncbi:hypothetical protein P7K49_027715 [Saguinus oedipus]|uniref:Uncharacterized protein n=1 Tax=Saguinus oedipus TaxID=9490 RepID=A0ABQ9UA80_SAGOE|nr:hypothetical protein P7K49_027715 [Saguinus oedipus]
MHPCGSARFPVRQEHPSSLLLVSLGLLSFNQRQVLGQQEDEEGWQQEYEKTVESPSDATTDFIRNKV